MSKDKYEVEMYESTYHTVMRIKSLSSLSSGSDVIKIAVDVVDTIFSAIQKGDRIIIESKDGYRELLMVDIFNKK